MDRSKSNLIQLHDCNAFDRRFEFHYVRSRTYTEAYEKTEEEYSQVFGQNKYASFTSFKKTYNRRILARK
jgi:hypothetical protein